MEAQSSEADSQPNQPNIEATGESSRPSQANKPDIMPQMKRADGQILSKEDEENFRRLRLSVEVISVHYQLSQDPGASGCQMCAVLLRTTFATDADSSLKFAVVPISAQHMKSAEGTQGGLGARAPPQVDIVNHYPEYEQVEPTRKIQRTKDVSLQPHFQASVAGSGGSIDGLGAKSHGVFDDFYTISLVPNPWTFDNRPRRIEWRYEDKYGIFYPRVVELLVIVQTKEYTPGKSFPFKLHLESDLTVDIHTKGVFKRLYTLFHSQPKPKEWVFDIQGKYQSSRAAEALRKAKEDPDTTGLPPPVKRWRDKQVAW